MRSDPQIVALKNDISAQRKLASRSSDAEQEWQSTQSVKLVLGDLENFGTGSDFEKCPALNRLLHDGEHAADFVSNWIAKFSFVLRCDSLCEIPFRQSYSNGLSTMRIAGSGNASLALLTYESLPSASPATTASFVDREQFEVVVSGNAHGQLHSLSSDNRGRTNIKSKARDWGPGDCIKLSPQTESRNIMHVKGAFTLLHLSRTTTSPGPSKFYALETGVLQKQVSGCKASSQRELAMAVLSAMRRDDAADAIGEWTKVGPMHSRWEAMRHALALNPRRGFAHLTDLANDPHDCLSRPAAQLREQLLKSHPGLLMEESKCLV